MPVHNADIARVFEEIADLLAARRAKKADRADDGAPRSYELKFAAHRSAREAGAE